MQGPKQSRELRRRLTPQEVKLWNWLRESIVPAGFRFRRQIPIDSVIVDFACLTAWLVVEIDGAQHATEAGLAADRARDAHLARRGYRVLRFSNRDIDQSKPVVLDTIYAALTVGVGPIPVGFADSPSPAGEGSGVVSP